MLVTQNCTSSVLHFDIFYKYQKLLFLMSISKPQQTKTRTDIAQFRTDYEIHLKKLDLTQSTDRWVFANMTVSLIEVLSKNQIKNIVDDFDNVSSIRREWPTLLVHAKPYKMPKFNDNNCDSCLGDYISDKFSYQSPKVLELAWVDFSLLDNFLSEYPTTEKMKIIIEDSNNCLSNKSDLIKYLMNFYKKRNLSAHGMVDYCETDANVMKDHLEEFIDVILDMYAHSLQVRRRNVDSITIPSLPFDDLTCKKLLKAQIDFCEKYVDVFELPKNEFKKYANKNDLNFFWLDSKLNCRVKNELKHIQKKLKKLKGKIK